MSVRSVAAVDEESARLVVPAVRDLRELLLVLATVVGAEQQFAARDDDADVRLRAACVAAIERGELVGVSSSSTAPVVSVYCVMAPPPGSRSTFRSSMKTRPERGSFRWAGHFAQRVAPARAVSPGVSRLERRELRLFRPPSLRPRGPRGGAQAARHVHRLDRLARPHALPLGDHRQLRRRGARRATAPRSA